MGRYLIAMWCRGIIEAMERDETIESINAADTQTVVFSIGGEEEGGGTEWGQEGGCASGGDAKPKGGAERPPQQQKPQSMSKEMSRDEKRARDREDIDSKAYATTGMEQARDIAGGKGGISDAGVLKR